MDFTYSGYIHLMQKLRNSQYRAVSYHDWEQTDKCVILRHDIDYSLSKAVELANLEQALGVRSTYFVLLSGDFYNVFSKESCKKLRIILSCGHELGLHFDETKYPDQMGNPDEISNRIQEEAASLSKVLDVPVTIMSMHRPSKAILESNLSIPGIINSYGNVFFKEFKYLSDSRRRWKEPVDQIVGSGEYKRLHILTHAFWYHKKEKDLSDTLSEFITDALSDRYHILNENFTDLESVIESHQFQRTKE